MNENWPHSRGVFVSHDKKFLIWVNEEDQLKVISM
jgi:creatine kinase/arginine kinase